MSDKNVIFTKDKLKRVSSPEQLNDYIKVSHPSVWLILTAVTLLLAGVMIWSVFGALTTVRDAVAVVENGKVMCYMSHEDADTLTTGQLVSIESTEGTVAKGAVTEVTVKPVTLPVDFDTYVLYVGGFQVGDFVVSFTADIAVPDGVYKAKVIVESVSPISFLLN